MLLFKKKFLEAIRTGEKTQTVRLWKACRFRTGQLSYVPGVGYIRISDVAAIRLDELTDDDAKLDGFPSAAALLTEIHTLYAERLNEGFQAYRLRFTRLSDDETETVRQRKQAAGQTKRRSAKAGPMRPRQDAPNVDDETAS